jgi:hypothetical protein
MAHGESVAQGAVLIPDSKFQISNSRSAVLIDGTSNKNLIKGAGLWNLEFGIWNLDERGALPENQGDLQPGGGNELARKAGLRFFGVRRRQRDAARGGKNARFRR